MRLTDGTETKDYQVLPRNVHINAVSDELENVTFMHCPRGRQVTVDVPLRLLGEDDSPGGKQGGFVQLLRRWIKLKCACEDLPRWFDLDVSCLALKDVIFAKDLKAPKGTQIVQMAPATPVVKMRGAERGSS